MTSRSSPVETLRRAAFRLSRPDILFWVLPLLMVILIAGTVAQKDIGLFAAQHKYFSSFIVWFGLIPFPGGAALILVFFVNLLMKFLLFSEWAWHKAGIILTHFGVLLLIVGGFFTALTEREGSLVIGLNDTASVAEDYHQRELRILEGDNPVVIIPHQKLEAGLRVFDPALPFTLEINTYCFNCDITRRPESDQEGWTSPGKFMQLTDAKPRPDNEANLTGIEFTIDGSKYVTFDKFPKPPVIEMGDKLYTIVMGRTEQPLPFSVTLTKFEQELYPGTNMARAYRSDVVIRDGDQSWPASITMNEPLRYKGYTLYQSSFDLSGEKPFTVLNVVRNTGRLFPYISSLIMTLGLLLHIAIRLRRKGLPT
jgi:hypothetical protein